MWRTVRARRPLLVERPECRRGPGLRRPSWTGSLALDADRAGGGGGVKRLTEQTLYEILEVPPDAAPPTEIERALRAGARDSTAPARSPPTR